MDENPVDDASKAEAGEFAEEAEQIAEDAAELAARLKKEAGLE